MDIKGTTTTEIITTTTKRVHYSLDDLKRILRKVSGLGDNTEVIFQYRDVSPYDDGTDYITNGVTIKQVTTKEE